MLWLEQTGVKGSNFLQSAICDLMLLPFETFVRPMQKEQELWQPKGRRRWYGTGI